MRTGSAALRASAAAIASTRVNVLAPKLPPIGGEITRTSPSSSAKAEASSRRTLKGVWVPVHTVRRPSLHSASEACGSSGACAAPAHSHSPSTMTSASSKPASPRPCRSRNVCSTLPPPGRRPVQVPAASRSSSTGCSCGAPSASAASSDVAPGKGS